MYKYSDSVSFLIFNNKLSSLHAHHHKGCCALECSSRKVHEQEETVTQNKVYLRECI